MAWDSVLTSGSGHRVKTMLPPNNPPIISYYKAPTSLTFLAMGLSFVLTYTQAHVHTLFSSLSSFPRFFHVVFPPGYGPQRITSGHQFGVISTIWTMKLLHLRVFVKVLSQELLLVCSKLFSHCWVWSKTQKWSANKDFMLEINWMWSNLVCGSLYFSRCTRRDNVDLRT